MMQILFTSSVLILALFVLRAVFLRAIPRRVQYALWALVLLRLLVPFSLPGSAHSLAEHAQGALQTAEAAAAQPIYTEEIGTAPLKAYPEAYGVEPGESFTPRDIPRAYDVTLRPNYAARTESGEEVTLYKALSFASLARLGWYIGMAGMSAWFIFSNLRFAQRLRRSRRTLSEKNRVYVSDEITSPCLFGLFHPAIYVTPEAAADKTRLRHVLIHENTHKRHLDPLWSLLRAVCLIVWFFDPLVWLAAYVSRIDGELACDEGALAVLGEDERIAYGETLLALIPVRRTPSPMLASTLMASGKKRMRDRITRIAEHKKPLVISLAAVLVLAAVIGAACFMGRSNRVDVELHGLRWAQHDIYYTEPVDLEIHGTIRRRLFDYDLFYGTVTLGEIRQEYNGQMKLAIMPWEDENYKTGLLQASGFYYDSVQDRLQPTGFMVFDSDYSKFLMFSIDTEHYYSFPAETREEALKIAQQTAGKMLMVFSESPDPDTLPEYLVVDESAEIDTALRQAYDLNAERVHFEPEALIDSLFLSPEYEMRGGNSVGYFGEPDGEYQDYLTLGDGKVGIASDESADNYGWFAYFRDPMDGADPALRYQDFAAPRPFSDGTNVNSGNTDLSEPPSLTRRLAPFDKTALSFGSLDEARAEFSQVLASLGADGLGIRYGCAMDTETMNALGMHYKDALLPEDGDAFFFRIMQSYNGIPFLDVDWTAKRSSASDSEPRLQSATAGEAFINQNGLVRLSLSGIYNARTNGEAQRLISCAEALESVIAFYTPDPPEMPVHVQSALLCYVTTDIPEKGRTYRYIPAYVFDVWEYETHEVDGETLQYAILNRFVIDAKTGARLSENGESAE